MQLLVLLLWLPLSLGRKWQHLTHDWTAGRDNLFSALAKEILTSQSRAAQRGCAAEDLLWHSPANAGMGSDIHVWSQALCNAMHRGKTLIQPGRAGGDWVWADPAFCKYTGGRTTNSRPFFECYFNEGNKCKLSAHQELAMLEDKNAKALESNLDFATDCPTYITDMPSRQKFRAASMEYLFSNINEALVKEADDAAAEVFHFKNIPRTSLITVHVRWGDKIREMKLVGVREYMHILEQVVTENSIDTPYVYLTTETFEAYNAFNRAFSNEKYSNWTLLNYRHSLAGKGGVSGYRDRSGFDKNSSGLGSGDTHGKEQLDIGDSKSRLRLGRGGKKTQALTDLLDNSDSVESRMLGIFNKKGNVDQVSPPATSTKPSPVTSRKRNEKNSKMKPIHSKRHPQKKKPSTPNNPYKITPAIKAVSPMSLAKTGSRSLGRHSIIALLIAMEAKHYVLTTGSNWSRIINELRLSVLEGKCAILREKTYTDSGVENATFCTSMVDLMKGDSPDWRMR